MVKPIDERVSSYRFALALYFKACAAGDKTAVRPKPEDHNIDGWLANQLEPIVIQELNPESIPTQSVPLIEQITCCEKELRRRQEACPKLVDAGRMSQEQSEKAINRMAAVLETLKQVQKRWKI